MPLDHVALTVSDRERSAAFYAEHFGLTQRVHDDEHLLILGDEHGSLLALSTGARLAEDLPRSRPLRLPPVDPRRGARARASDSGGGRDRA